MNSPRRLNNGYTLIIPGILGRCPWDENVAMSLADSDVPMAIEIHDWTKGPLMLGYNARAKTFKQRQARRIARKIVNYEKRYPGRPVHLIGHSGGATMAVLALEELPRDVEINSAILMAAGLSPEYDLSDALSHTDEGIHSFHSHYDAPISMLFATLVGTAEGKHTIASGALGFKLPKGATKKQRLLYEQRLTQHPYEFGMLRDGHIGGHFGWTTTAFVQEWLVPIVSTQPPSDSTDPPADSQFQFASDAK